MGPTQWDESFAYFDKIRWEDSLPFRILEAVRSEDILLAAGAIGRVLLLLGGLLLLLLPVLLLLPLPVLLLSLLLHPLPVLAQAVQYQLLVGCRHHRTI